MNILEKIAINKRLEIEELKLTLPLKKIRDDLTIGEGLFSRALKSDGISIIAEVKKGSPSKGIISESFDPVNLAQKYLDGGAAALSILTESKYFYGSYENLSQIRSFTKKPLLCKDFLLDPYQLYHARYIGADAALLIVRLLTRSSLENMISTASEIGVDVLVEAHDADELNLAVDAGAKIIGVNNRNLQTFEVSLETAVQLSSLIPSDCIKVAESGIFTVNDIHFLKTAGYNNFLIGEALVKAEDPGQLIKEMCSV